MNALRRSARRLLLVLFTTFFVVYASRSDGGTFTQPPTATSSGGTVKIRFATSAATSVEVAVVDAKGTVVRHLAAGMLGENAPAPLKANTLEQSLTWDGKDDAGKAVSRLRGPLSVRVGLGTRAEFERVIFHQPGISFAPRAVTVAASRGSSTITSQAAATPGE